MHQLGLINLEDVSQEEIAGFWVREAARAIVFDGDGNVALLHATKNNYYKLPGGGIEEGEDNEAALKRECLEEIGCKVEIIGEVGMTIEYRKKYKLNQISYCYIAKVVGEKGTPKLEKDEIEEGFETIWLPIDEALRKVKESKKIIYEAQYMIARDTALLDVAKNITEK